MLTMSWRWCLELAFSRILMGIWGICCGSLRITVRDGAYTTCCGGMRMSCRVSSCWSIMSDMSSIADNVLGLVKSDLSSVSLAWIWSTLVISGGIVLW